MLNDYKERCSQLLEKYNDFKVLNDYEYFKDVLSEEEFKEQTRLKQNRKNKRYRCDNKIKEMLQFMNYAQNNTLKIVFGTLTLNDKTLATKENTYIRKIHKYLKEHYLISILNKDFGDETEREHYHFIGLTLEEIISTGKKSNKGFEMYNLVNDNYVSKYKVAGDDNPEHNWNPNITPIELDTNKKVRNYLLKLNNHSNKSTTESRIRVLKNDLFKLIYTNEKESKMSIIDKLDDNVFSL